MNNELLQQDNIKYEQLTEVKLGDAVAVGRQSFFVDETVCKMLDLKNNTIAMDELEELFIKAAEDGVSIVAVDIDTDSVVGVAFNKLHVKNHSDINYYEEYSNRCTDTASKSFLSFMKATDLGIDMFTLCPGDCYLEIMFLGVMFTHRGKSIAYNLCKVSEALAQILSSSCNVEKSENGTPVILQPIPQFISAMFTSPASQRIGDKMNMQIAGEVQLDQCICMEEALSGRNAKDVSIQYRYKVLEGL